MSDEPKKIWAKQYENGIIGARDRKEPYSSLSSQSDYVEYIRADLCDPLRDERVQRLVDAAKAVCDVYYSQEGSYVSGMADLDDAVSAFKEPKP